MELARRRQKWSDGAFMELLERAEEQCRQRAKIRAALRRAPKHGDRARRARSLIGEGAYSKAASSLHTDVADRNEEAHAHWGAALLPCSARLADVALPNTGVEAGAAPAAVAAVSVPDADSGAGRDGAATALKGVRFRAMTGPGPSGARPEHLRELIAVRDRRCSGAMLAAIGKLVEVATAGKLCEAARWILDSRLVFLAKKSGAAPRPIRIGEVWRRVIA